jgi:tetratricopeptide (TPR) repeat protein
MNTIRFFIVALFSFSLLAGHAQSEKNHEQLFALGNEAYITEKYDEAINFFQTILAEGVHSPELYLNLGNAYFKNKNTAASILYYERGLLIDPNNQRILNNLSFAENQRLDKIDPLPLPLGQRIINQLFNVIPIKLWGIISLILGGLGLSMFVIFRASKHKFWWRSSLVLFAASFVLYALTFKSKTLLDSDDSAIVFEPRVLVLSEPKPEAQVLFELHEGTKVKVEDSFQGFAEVKLANGQSGWLKEQDIRRIKF